MPVTSAEPVTMLDHALRYAALGYAVVPLHTPVGKGCSCRKADCTSVGKHPRTLHGLNDATVDTEKITTWWSGWPDANIGISCGPSGLVVIDIDPKNGGDYRDLAVRIGEDALDTCTADTGGGGYHLVYRCPPGVHIGNVNNSPRFTGPLGPGIDVRAEGGYIVAPPSLHASGYIYDWEIGLSPLDRVPARLPDTLLDILAPKPKKDADTAPLDMASILDGVPSGERDWQLFLAAAKLRGADVPRDMAYALIEGAAARCTPPFGAAEARRKVDSAYDRYPAGRVAVVAPDALKHADGLSGRVMLDAIVEEGTPPIEWLEEPILVRGTVTMLYGEPESGKTVFAAHWIRNAVEAGIPVLFIDEESGPYKIADFFRDMGAPKVDDALHYIPFPGLDMADADALMAYAEELRPGLVVFDSLTDMLASAGLDENSGIEVTKWMLAVPQRLARSDWQPAVLLIDHISKDAGNTKYSVASRAKKAKSDVLWLVEKQDDFDRTKTANVDLFRHKNRPGVLPSKLSFVVGGRDGMLVVEPFDVLQHGITTLSVAAKKVLSAIGEETLQNKDIQGRTKYKESHVRAVCADLVKKELLIRVSENGRDAYKRNPPVPATDPPMAGAQPATLTRQNTPLLGGGLAGGGWVAGTEREDEPWWNKD